MLSQECECVHRGADDHMLRQSMLIDTSRPTHKAHVQASVIK